MLNNAKFSEDLGLTFVNSDLDISEQQIKQDNDDIELNENEYPPEENEGLPEENEDPPGENEGLPEVNKDMITNTDSKIPTVKGRRSRIAKSVVHEHFYKVKIYHPVTKKPVPGAICRHCKDKFSSRISTNLKRHLKNYHPEAFKEVESK